MKESGGPSVKASHKYGQRGGKLSASMISRMTHDVSEFMDEIAPNAIAKSTIRNGTTGEV